MQITLFDTGRLRPGGRCASRLPNDLPAVIKNRSSGSMPVRRACDDTDLGDGGNSNDTVPDNIASILRGQQTQIDGSRDRIFSMGPVDHAAQILSIPHDVASLVDDSNSDSFQSQVKKWLEDGVLESFPEDSVCELVPVDPNADLSKAKLYPIKGEMYYGKGGMSSIPLAMRSNCLSYNNPDSASFQIQQDVWVSPSNGVKYTGNKNDDSQPQWELRAGSKSLGKYHRLVIAHNGKCADRIMSKTPARAFHSLLRTKFAPYVPKWGGKEMTLNSIYSLVFAVKSPKNNDGPTELNSPIANALKQLSQPTISNNVYTVMIRNEPNLRLISSNTLKHHHTQNPSSQSNIEVYTLLSSAQFGKQYKGPQENLPLDLMQTVTMEMLQSLERALGIEKGMVIQNVVDMKLQLWGAAVPMNTWKSGNGDGFVYDSQHGVGAAGDWILDPSIAGAWESGRRLAGWIVDGDGSIGLPDLSAANDASGKFVPSRAALSSGIGTIPSTTNSVFEFPSANNDGTKSQFASKGGRGSEASSRRQNFSGRRNGGGGGRSTMNTAGKRQPVSQ